MAIADDLLPLAQDVDSLLLLPGNPRRGDVAAVAASLQRFGQRKPIVARARDRVVIAGNHTLQAARSLDWSEVAVVFTDDDDATAQAFALADNRTAELGSYDDENLLAMITAVGEVDAALLADTGWDPASVDELLANLEELPPVTRDSDAVPESAPAKTVEGDVWLLGQHRVMCGDSSVPDVLDRIFGDVTVGCVLTDPPYGMNLDTDYSKMPGVGAKAQMHRQPTKYRPVAGDDEAFDASFLRSYFAAKEQFWFGADYYRSSLSDDDRDGSWLVWDKRKEDGSQDDVLGSGFELLWTAVPHQRRLLRHYWCGAFGSPEARNRSHPTQKPVALLMDILSRWSPAGCVVADPFGGSGSTLLAAHRTGRTARLIELDPQYVDVICRRYQEATGEKPIAEATGEPHDFDTDT